VRLTDTIASHPKILRAGDLIGGPSGRAVALSMYVAAIGYSRHFLTDGFVPRGFLKDHPLIGPPEKNGGRKEGGPHGETLAKAFTHRDVNLWERAPGGWRIHDWAAFNESSKTLKKRRAATAERVRSFRRRSRERK
jgi:hypothetical protein